MESSGSSRNALSLRAIWARASNPPHYVARCRLPATQTAGRIHAFTRREIRKRRAGAKRLGLWLQWALWSTTVPIRVLRKTGSSGWTIRKRTGKGLWRQATEQLRFAWFGAIPPKAYYRFRLYLPERRAQAGDYLHRFETKGKLYRFLSPENERAAVLQDKLAFAQDCRERGVRTAPVLMEFRGGRALAVEADCLPPHDLIVKPRIGKGGRMFTRWLHLDDGRYESNAGFRLDADGLLRHLCEQSRRQSFLVQPRLVNHRELSDLSPDVLMTARMVTCTNEDGDGELTNASFRASAVRIRSSTTCIAAGSLLRWT